MLCVPLASLDGLVSCPASPSRVPPEILSDIKKEAYISFVLFFYQSFFFTVWSLPNLPFRLAAVERGQELLAQMAKDCENIAQADKPKREGNRVYCFLKPKTEKS